ncbi:MAG: DUF3810 domain-containing protein [Planctomycetes bacterium]|nr:DUF3810 domain-containing protein [Planctomycetota bacterium]
MRDKRVRWKRKLPVISLLPLAILLILLASTSPNVVEQTYSRGLFQAFASGLGALFGWLPFSLTEFALVGTVMWLLFRAVYNIVRVKNHERSVKNLLKRTVVKTLCVAAVVIFSFTVLWGLNYQRQPLAQSFGFEEQPVHINDLKAAALRLSARCAELRPLLSEHEDGVMALWAEPRAVLAEAEDGYRALASRDESLARQYGVPKPLALSPLLSSLWIGGFYFPFTGEANINVDCPAPMLPFIVCHELAHQKGYAHEDEANFLGYLACDAHSRPDFAYSGNLMALRYVLLALKKASSAEASEALREIPESVVRDIRTVDQWFIDNDSWARSIAVETNDLYLKANGATDGVQSYGRMVDLLVAELRARENAAG